MSAELGHNSQTSSDNKLLFHKDEVVDIVEGVEQEDYG